MKKIFAISSLVLLTMALSCSDKGDGNKNVLAAENAEAVVTTTAGSMNSDGAEESTTDRYVAEDGSSALVTFSTKDSVKSISILSNRKTITAPQTDVMADGEIYGSFDFEIVKKDSVITITQGNNVIILRKARTY